MKRNRKKAISLLLAVFVFAICLSFSVNASEETNNNQQENINTNIKSLEEAKITVKGKSQMYDGTEKTPDVKVVFDDQTLIKDQDYEIVYSDNKAIGTASIEVKGIGDYTGSQTVTFTIYLSSTKLSTTAAYNQVKIDWDKVNGATGYKIYRSTLKNSGFKLVKDVTSGSTVTYTDANVTFNETYYYKIQPYANVDGKTVNGAFSLVKAQQVQLETTTITKITRNSPTALVLTWDKVAGASGYEIYRSTSETGTYSKIGTVKGETTVTYTDSNCTCGVTYYYKVRAYRTVSGTDYYGAKSVAKSYNTVPAKVSWNTASMKATSTTATLVWKKATGAQGYYIYRSESKSGTYTKVKTISSGSTLTWKNTGLVSNKKYYYKISAYCTVNGETIEGSLSDVFTKAVAGWKYVNGYKLYYDASGNLVKDVSSIIGKQSSYVIKVNKKQNTVTVYAKDGSKGYIIPVKAFVCSTGAATPLGTFYTPQKYRWHTLDGPSYGQWCTRITGSILFHSVWYYQPKNTTLSVTQYNKLGTTASHGCVRLTAGDAKWIYDNCSLKTKVIIYNSSTSGPLGKPSAYKLASWHTWDPTDPNVKSKCKSKGCH